jgi:hypothetical protein
MNERDLLKRLINEGILGKGKGNFEVNVGSNTPKYIDLVYETDSEIWLIEAKINLDYKALGQILSYKKLYLQNFMPSKPIKLGIACLRLSNEEIKDFYESYKIKVLLLEEKETEKEVINPVCGICGRSMEKDENDDWVCKTCEYFFGISSKLTECEECGCMYGTYPAVEWRVLGLYNGSNAFRRRYEGRNVCIKCIDLLESWNKEYNTIADLIKGEMEERFWTKQDLTCRGIPEEFIKFCLGKMEINL